MISVDLGALAAACSQLAREDGPQEVLDTLVEAAPAVLPSCDRVSVTMVRDSGAATVAATDDVVRHFDALQYDTGQGPCLEALERHEPVVVPELSTDRRWPALARASHGLQVDSVMAVPLIGDQEVHGSLNMASSVRHAFPPVEQQLATVLALHAAAQLAAARQRERAAQLGRELAAERRAARAATRFRTRLGCQLRDSLMALGNAVALLDNDRGGLGRPAREALDLLAEELEWQRQLTLKLLRTDESTSERPALRIPERDRPPRRDA